MKVRGQLVAGIVAAVGLLAWGRRAEAHKPSDSYLTLDLPSLSSGAGAGRWDIAVRDLDDALALDGDGDGVVSWRDLRLQEGEVARYALGRLALRAAAGPCALAAGALAVVEHSDGAYVSLPLSFTCPVAGPGAPESLTIDYRLLFDLDPQHQGLARVGGGAAARALIFTARAPTQVVAEEGRAPASFLSFVVQGVRHIWGGLDHVLFLLALLGSAVLPRAPAARGLGIPPVPTNAIRSVLWDVGRIVTSFTLAHSITLALAALDLARMPARLTEPAIAASVVVAAANNVWPIFGRDRWVVAFALGLLHGFGFASVLTDIALGRRDLLPALAGFNAGVELGQLAIVAAFVPVALALRGAGARRDAFYRRVALPAGSAAIGAIALFWFVERALDLPLLPLVVARLTPG